MSQAIEVRVPDIGDFQDVEVIEVLVAPGDAVAVDQSLITLESDKATMEIPAPSAGVVRELAVSVGARVSEGSLILRLEPAASAEPAAPAPPATEAAREAPAAAPAVAPAEGARAGVVVLGAGPGGYTAAFRAADLGLEVVLVERYEKLGGVCLNVGCIPSKTLLHLSEVITEARELSRAGIEFGPPRLDLAKIRARKDAVVQRLTLGLAGLAKRRGVKVVRGEARLVSPHELEVKTASGPTRIGFAHAILAAGSRAVRLPGSPEDPRIMDSTAALALEEIPQRLLVIGGGIIGLEMAAVFSALGSRVTVVELLPELLAGADRDLVKPLQQRIEKRYEKILLSTRVTSLAPLPDGVHVTFEGPKAPPSDTFQRVLVAVGRRPNGDLLGAEAAGLHVDERGFVRVDAEQRTNLSHVFAIGDLVGEPMLAHKASHEGKVAAEVIAGQKSAFDARAIPSVAYTDPEVAWMGLTETQAAERGIAVEKAVFPWLASARALGIGREEGLSKLLFEPGSRRLLGAGIVGRNAGELISELVLALEMGADAADIALSIHPHPTLSETLAFAAEMAEGTITDLYLPKR
ncbi:MAG: dihydrolipoyl dehydrogenase [Candidatus Limnocylindria bacterium]|jgi:dihydrolipoamide dehydrogenase